MATVTKDMTFHEVMSKSPEVAKVLGSFNLGCVGCMALNTKRWSRAQSLMVLMLKCLLLL